MATSRTPTHLPNHSCDSVSQGSEILVEATATSRTPTHLPNHRCDSGSQGSEILGEATATSRTLTDRPNYRFNPSLEINLLSCSSALESSATRSLLRFDSWPQGYEILEEATATSRTPTHLPNHRCDFRPQGSEILGEATPTSRTPTHRPNHRFSPTLKINLLSCFSALESSSKRSLLRCDLWP